VDFIAQRILTLALLLVQLSHDRLLEYLLEYCSLLPILVTAYQKVSQLAIDCTPIRPHEVVLVNIRASVSDLATKILVLNIEKA